MKKLIALALVTLGLAGCGTQPKVLSSSPRTVSVRSFKGMAEAQKVADAECAKHSRYARWTAGNTDYIFDCVN